MAGAVVAIGAVLLATLTPSDSGSLVRGGFFCVSCGSAGLANIIRNVILFVPVGLFLYLMHPSVRRVTLMGFLLTAVIESLQAVIPGRNPLLVDLLANGFGAFVGATAAATLSSLRGMRGWRRGFLAFSACASMAGAAGLPSLLLVTGFMPGDLSVQWNPRLGSPVAYPGPVVDARIGERFLPRQLVVDEPAEIADAFRAGELIVVTFEKGAPVAQQLGLFRILVPGAGRSTLTVTADEESILLTLPYMASFFGMTNPRLRLRDAVAGIPEGDTITLSFALRPGGAIDATAGDRAWHFPGVDPSTGWSLLYFPPGTGALERTIFGFLWSFGLLFGATFWSTRPSHVAVAGGAVLALLLLPPITITHLAPLALSGWIGSLAGWATGWRFARRAWSISTAPDFRPDPAV